ncbi:hypothetical protein N1851_000186 [Merluccius polli]|uniref:CCHC-type domain-containing protein n=1 Tax=Merluccius polli TaxID=89951 RepID=A0AA47PE41_MERPO|nr:hypothetical protein N1851_000186 [Merluccius polli]
MNVTIGTLSAFDSEEQTWEEYCEIIEQFFEANGIDDGEKQRAILISVVGPATYKLIRNLVSPEKPSSKTYDQIATLMKNHFNPKPSEIVQRYKFDSRSRQPSETVSSYVAELRRLAHDCNFGTTLEQRLRDRLVCGVNDDRIQRRLLSETDVTFEKAFKIAVAAEAASKNVQDLQTKAPLACNSVKTEGKERKGDWKKRECYRCHGKQHSAFECKFKEAKCHSCGKVGHIAKACRSKNEKNPHREERRVRSQGAHNVCERQDSNDSSEEEEAFTLACIKTETSIKRIKPFEVKVEVNRKKVNFEIDTGCSVSVMNETTFHKMWKENKRPQLKETKLSLRSYTGEKIKVAGVADVEVTYAQQVKTLPLVVVKGTGPSLLGRGWLETLKLKWDEIKHVRTETQGLQQVLSKHEDVFKEELGMLKGMKATIRVSAEACPKFYRPRSVPYAMRAKVEEELERLLRENIIEPVKYAEWAAPIVPVLKPDGSIRICGDYKLTVNSASSLEQYPIPRVEDLFNTLTGGKQFSKLDLSHAYQQIVMDDESKKYLTVNTHRGLFTYNRLAFGMGSPRVQRWATLLRAYEYKIIYKPGKEHANADALSRLPLPQTDEEDDTEKVLMLDVLEDPPITTAQVKQWTTKDATLSQVLLWCLKGWPNEVDTAFKPYSQRKLELIRTGDGRIMRRHVDQIRKRHATLSDMSSPEVTVEPYSLPLPEQAAEALPTDSVVPTSVGGEVTETAQVQPSAGNSPEARAEPSLVLRRSERTRKTPDYLKDFVRQ